MFVRLEGNLVSGFKRRVIVTKGTRKPTLEQHWLSLDASKPYCDFNGTYVVITGNLFAGFTAIGPIADNKLEEVRERFEDALFCRIVPAEKKKKQRTKAAKEASDKEKRKDKVRAAIVEGPSKKQRLWETVVVELPTEYQKKSHRSVKKFGFSWEYIPEDVRKKVNMFVTDVASGMRVSKAIYGPEVDQPWVGNWLTTAEAAPKWFNFVQFTNGKIVKLPHIFAEPQ